MLPDDTCPPCVCGCGLPVQNPTARFLRGHHWKVQTEQRFWNRVDKNGPLPTRNPELGPCWLWTGPKHRTGYGSISSHWQEVPAHRFSWELHNGPILDDLWVLHRCDNPPCVRPDHLFLGTPKDNTHDAIKKGRMAPWSLTAEQRARGERHGMARITAADVLAIRALYVRGATTLRSVGAQFGITEAHTYSIVSRRTWKHL